MLYLKLKKQNPSVICDGCTEDKNVTVRPLFLLKRRVSYLLICLKPVWFSDIITTVVHYLQKI